MNEFLLLLITISISGSLVFTMTLLVEYIFKNNYVQYFYLTMKFIIIFFLVPVSVVVYKVISSQIKTIEINTMDFEVISQVNLESFEMLAIGDKIGVVLFFIWIIGFLLFYVISTIKSIFFIRKLLRLSNEIRDGKILEIAEKVKKQLRIVKKVKIYQSSIVISPLLTGVFHPKIIIPNTTNNLKLMLSHELVHLKSNDILFRMLLNLVQKIHWFNPIIYIFANKFFDLSELACDNRVIEKMGREERNSYAQLLISISKERTKASKMIVPLKSDNYKTMERRIYQIMRYKKQKMTIRFILAICILALASPVVTYASSIGVLQAQDRLMEIYRSINSNEADRTNPTEELKYLNEEVNLDQAVNLGSLQARGVNSFDFTLKPGISILSPLSLKAGASIYISACSDNANDSYMAGYVSGGKFLYVRSVNGTVGHNFNITSDGTYTIYFENKGVSNIHIYATIRVTY
ncbi:Regulatory protein BlaR1 [Clostridiales bacterium CHKCI001]|nr:Regulatory protein BlaR1 [Clostridiales bacterium CHKCI001]